VISSLLQPHQSFSLDISPRILPSCDGWRAGFLKARAAFQSEKNHLAEFFDIHRGLKRLFYSSSSKHRLKAVLKPCLPPRFPTAPACLLMLLFYVLLKTFAAFFLQAQARLF
jgi:hypothetical protein